MNNFNLTKNEFSFIIETTRELNIVRVTDFEDTEVIKENSLNAIYCLLKLYFGEYNVNLISDYINGSDNNWFTSNDELYDYIKDPYSKLVSDKADSLDTMLELYPNYSLFKFFKKYIDGQNKKANI